MRRYHIKVYLPDNIKGKLKGFNDYLNTICWQYSEHCLDNIKHRIYNMEDILLFISQLNLDDKDIFELYTDDNDDIIKVCYRIRHDIFDLIIVISKNKKIITIYTNSKDDEHITLNKNIYARG
jgi:hypothetical protein